MIDVQTYIKNENKAWIDIHVLFYETFKIINILYTINYDCKNHQIVLFEDGGLPINLDRNHKNVTELL